VSTDITPRVSETERRRRWRLVLGSAADDALDDADGAGDGDSGDADPDGDAPRVAARA
jgi:hypothetical protein